MRRRAGWMMVAACAAAMVPRTAHAHVKWFAEFSFADRPLSLRDAATPAFFALAALSMAAIAALVWVDRRLEDAPWYRRVNGWLADRRGEALLVMRIGMFATLLLAWQADALLAPELRIRGGWIGWIQFVLALLLLFPRTVPVAGGGLIALYLLAAARFGAFHLLDYLFFAGVGWYLLTSRAGERVRGTGIPALYATIGFSLCWVALEKIVYPQWALYLLDQHPRLALGLDLRFFLLAAAFVELALGYLLVINLLQRPLALVITVVFFLTTTVFGKLEVIGHTPIHAALIVFLLEGPGSVYRPPIAMHRRMGLRTAFAAVNFALLLAVLLPLYAAGATAQARRHGAAQAPPAQLDGGGSVKGPTGRASPHRRASSASGRCSHCWGIGASRRFSVGLSNVSQPDAYCGDTNGELWRRSGVSRRSGPV
jgi:hypothetical protein